MPENEKKDRAIEAKIKKLLKEAEDDFEEIEEYISDNEDVYSGELAEFAFRTAVQMGNTEYIECYIDEIDLNDEGGYSSYLYETDDEEIKELLMDHGAFKSWEDYEDCRFAMETVNGDILAFDSDFQKEVFEKYKEKYDLTEEKISAILSDEDFEEELDRDVAEDLDTMCVSVEDGDFSFKSVPGEGGGYALKELLEELGWDCDFEGDSWKLETIGVYFIN